MKKILLVLGLVLALTFVGVSAFGPVTWGGEEKLANLNESINTLTNVVNELKTEKVVLLSELAQAEQDLDDLQAELDAANAQSLLDLAEIADLNSQIDDLNDEIADLNDEIADLELQLSIKTTQLSNANAEITLLEAQLQKANDDMDLAVTEMCTSIMTLPAEYLPRFADICYEEEVYTVDVATPIDGAELLTAVNNNAEAIVLDNNTVYTLTETLNITNDMYIFGQEGTVIEGDILRLIYIDGDISLYVEGIEFSGTGTPTLGDADWGATQIYANNGATLQVYNSLFSDFGRVGAYVKNGSVGIFDGNTFNAVIRTDDALQYSIMGYYGADVTITNNEFNFDVAVGITPRDDWGSSSISLGGIYEITSGTDFSGGFIEGNSYVGEGSIVTCNIYGETVYNDDPTNIYFEGTVADDNTWFTVADVVAAGLDTLYVDGLLTTTHSEVAGLTIVIISGEVQYID